MLKASLVNSLQLEKRLTAMQRHSLSNATLSRFALAHQIIDSNRGVLNLRSTLMPGVRNGNRTASGLAGRVSSIGRLASRRRLRRRRVRRSLRGPTISP